MSINNYIDIDNLRNNITIYIYTSPYVVNIAEYISKNLEKYNIKNYVISSLISDEHIELVNHDSNAFLFLVAFQSFLNYPNRKKILGIKRKKYILYQLEQINNKEKYDKYVNKELEIFMKNALYVLDYNMSNYNNISNEINKMFVGIPIIKRENNIDMKKKDIDILFYGNINNYRKKILDSISSKYNVKILEKSFDKELIEYISRSKVILNIHYYKDALLELCRIHEAIPYNCKILSETSNDDLKLCNDYKDFCSFIDFDDIDKVYKKLDEELKNYENIDFDRIIQSNFDNYNENFKKFVIKIKYYNLFSKDLLNIKNGNINYELSILDKNNNITNISQKFIGINKTHIEKDININFNSEKQNVLYLDILKKVNRINNVNREILQIKKKYYDNIAHLHCYNLSEFDEIYGDYKNNIIKFFNIIITYSIISKEGQGYKTINSNFILLNIENKGMDIGAKFCLVDYLMKNNIEYKYILFLHSKKNIARRKKYFSLINDKNIEQTMIKIHDNYDGIFPNLILNGDWNTKKWYINKSYTEDLLEYLNCTIENKKFIEGNCMILSYRIVKKIFEDNLFIYELLNKKDSFDLNWFTWYYKCSNNSIINNYETYLNKNLYGNDLHHNYKEIFGSKSYINIASVNTLDGYKLADGMIEHAFERIYLNVIESFSDGKYHIINYDDKDYKDVKHNKDDKDDKDYKYDKDDKDYKDDKDDKGDK